MKILIIFLLLDIFGLISSPASDANAKFSQNDLYILREKSILRGHYKDVQKVDHLLAIASSSNGAILSSARTNIFGRPSIDNNPLRNSLYFSDSGSVGHVYVQLKLDSIIVEFLQAYEINRIRFWMWDGDTRITEMQVYIIGADRLTESLIHDILTQPGVYLKNIFNFLVEQTLL